MKYLSSKIMSLVLLFALIFTDLPTINADVPAYVLSITRDGKKMKKVAYNFWSGEYPGPVIDVNSKVDERRYPH